MGTSNFDTGSNIYTKDLVIHFFNFKYFMRMNQSWIMAPRKKTSDTVATLDDETREIPKLFNIATKGLGYYDKYAKVIQVSDVSLKLVGK